jgi:Ca2+-transporting ATPase
MPKNNIQNTAAWHQLTVNETSKKLQVHPQKGLSHQEAANRTEKFGPNELIDRGGRSIWSILWAQLTDVMVLVLFAAALISLLISDWKDAVAIFAIVLLNTIIGLVQEYRAEQAMAALKQMASPSVKVRRSAKLEEIDAKMLVPGDVIFLEAGSKVPADARLLDTANLRVEEASLTGESEPVDKTLSALEGNNITLGDQTNMLFMGTTITYGRGSAIVVSTGMNTELGQIAEMIQGVEEEQTPLQKRMNQMGKNLALVALAIVTLVFALGLLRGEDPGEMFLTAVAMAVAAVPEGLPAVVAIALALGAQRMLKRQSLIRKLPAVETLGSVTVISSDKTGTLTANQMELKMLDVAGNTFHLDPIPGPDHALTNYQDLNPAARLLILGGVLNNDAQLVQDEDEPDAYLILGDPTEGALVSAGKNLGLDKNILDSQFPRKTEVPFSSERKRMTTVHGISETTLDKNILSEIPGLEAKIETISFTKGAGDGILSISDRVYTDGHLEPLDESWKSRIQTAMDTMAQDGLRVLGLGYKLLNHRQEQYEPEQLESSLVFLGLFGMMDPPRPEAFQAVKESQQAGIRTMMITGDHPLTAERIARDLGISKDGKTLTGKELSVLSDQELEDEVKDVNVYARVAPEHKLRIVTALQELGEVVAMTGDGVNDAPALRKADIGVAMGITGTDVSKEAADMVLLDDNYATIVSAVREGRTIFSNIKKFIRYTMTSNAGEVMVMLLAPFLGMPLPLTALQILWINLVTDGLPGLALSIEPTEENTMDKPPIDPKKGVFSDGVSIQIIWVGILMAFISLGVGYWGWATGNPYWQTMVFTTLTLSQMGNALAARSDIRSLFQQGLRTNFAMVGAVSLTLILQLIITYYQPLNGVFRTQPLPLKELLISLVASLGVFTAVEIEKLIKRLRK